MIRYSPVALMASMALLVGCGFYTNVPAQIHVKSIAPNAALVHYNPDKSVTVDTPVLTLEGEPGSIGVTYSVATIQYFTDPPSGAPQDLTNLDQTMDLSLRVDSSALSTSSGTGSVATGTWTLPVITTPVIQQGMGGNTPSISADITLSGEDDAHFPATLKVSVPIYFQQGYTQ